MVKKSYQDKLNYLLKNELIEENRYEEILNFYKYSPKNAFNHCFKIGIISIILAIISIISFFYSILFASETVLKAIFGGFLYLLT